MIENIRKYTALIIFFMALVIVSLVVGIKDDLFRGGGGGGAGVMKIAGRTYGEKDFRHIGGGAFELASALAQAGEFELYYQFVMLMTSGAKSQEEAAEKFFINRIILRQAKEDLGIHPGEDEISDYIRGMRAFSTPDGKFDQARYETFIKRQIGRLGMTESDLRDLASDVLAVKRINAIVGAGLGVNRDIVARNLALQNQSISGELARFEIDPFEAKINPDEEQVRAYWENIQDAFTTQPMRKFTYIIATPNMPADEVKTPEAPESIADAAASDEKKKELEKKAADERAQKTAKLAEERRKIQEQLDSLVDDFVFQLEENKGQGLEELAKKNGWEAKTTDLFARISAPADLNVALRASSRGGKAVDELFRIEPTSDPLSKISQPIAVGENQWLVARLDAQESSRTKTFEEAKDEVRLMYIKEKAAEAMKAEAENAANKIRAGMASGKSFAEAAKEAGITETRNFAKVTSTYQPDAATEPRNLFQAVRNVDTGSLADEVIEADRAFVIHVASREVEKQSDAAARVDAELANVVSQNELFAFVDWLAGRVEAAKVQKLY